MNKNGYLAPTSAYSEIDGYADPRYADPRYADPRYDSLYPNPSGKLTPFKYGYGKTKTTSSTTTPIPTQYIAPKGDVDLNDHDLSGDLLGIIDKGVNEIVYKLKLKLGNTQNEINNSTYDIKELLNSIGLYVNSEATTLLKQNDDPNVVNFTLEDNKYKVPTNINYFNPINPDKQFSKPEPELIKDFNLTSNFSPIHSTYDSNYFHENNETDISTPAGLDEVKKRLDNCQNLEFLYLRKHSEIMKIFAFTINLFDKYKYAIKVILFLLKYLLPNTKFGEKIVNVDEEEGEGNRDKQVPINVKLPEPIIKNIKAMLDDEQKIQGVINTMRSVIIDNKIPGAVDQNGIPIIPGTRTIPNADLNHIEKFKKLPSKLPSKLGEKTTEKDINNSINKT
uniref:Uncharacterized protein n=1 Tax=viral metagenome TaxID=1070528 RepID=A0A6C0EX63_9ZZZZ